jgi:triosephosphate isomerase
MARPLVVGNWKMNTTQEEATTLIRSIVPAVAELSSADVVVMPPFPWLTDVARLLRDSAILLGAQNMHPETGGAYTGEVSPRMLKGLCTYVLVGQYERRIFFGEKDAIVRRKMQVAQQHGLKPILCVGETADHLDEGLGPFVVAEQLEANLADVTIDAHLVVAYDPVWTTMGLVAPPPLHYVADMVAHVRDTLVSLYAADAASQVRIIYGGSVTPRNVADIAALAHIDGVLSGVASLNAESFTTLVRAFAARA